MSPSLPVAFGVLGAGAVLLWSGFRDPEGGPVGELGRILRGEQTGPRPAASGGVASIIPALAGAGTGGSAGAAPASTTPRGTTTGGAGAGGGLVAAARKYLGVPYKYAGESPTTGMDCSGLVWYCCTHDLGMPASFPRTAATQQAAGPGRMVSTPAAGDLVFFGVPAFHVGVVVGDGTMIHAPQAGDVVKVESLSTGWAMGQHKTYRRLTEGTTA